MADDNVVASEVAENIRGQILALESHAVPAVRNVRRTFSRQLKTADAATVLEIVFLLLGGQDVPRWLPYELIHHHEPAMTKLNLRILKRLGDGLNGWGEVDAFACYLSGPAWRNETISDTAIHRWAKSSDRWWRRVAVVSTVALNRTSLGGTGDARRTLAVCDLVKSDRDDMVVKALSWALRELAKKEPEAVRKFIDSQERLLAKRVIRDAQNKLEIGLKNPRRARAPRR